MDTYMRTISSKAETATIEVQAGDYAPVRILELELGQPLPAISAIDDKTSKSFRRANCLVRLHTEPLGIVELTLEKEEVSPDEYVQHIWHALHAQITEHLQQDGFLSISSLDERGIANSGTPRCLEERERFLADAPFVSVIVPTHDRPERIATCLRSLLALEYPRYEVIIVDNAPSTTATEELIQRTYQDVAHLRYVREERPSPSLARNCGMMAASGKLLAFVDDDVVVDAHWLTELVRAFSLAEDVACVTGLVLPLELETPAQFWFEEYGGFSKGFTRRIFDMQENHPGTPLHPYTAGRFGTGASMAFTAAFLRSVGGFDPALGAGTPAQNGEDIALLFQVVSRGYKLVYQPAALVYHLHRRDYAGLRKQISAYGVGLTAYLTKCLLDNPRLLLDLVIKVPYGLFFSLSSRSVKNSKKSAHFPKELTRLERKGMLYGSFAYLWSRWLLRKVRKASAPDETYPTLPVVREI
jgi:GT2 family glycosyltransferase